MFPGTLLKLDSQAQGPSASERLLMKSTTSSQDLISPGEAEVSAYTSTIVLSLSYYRTIELSYYRHCEYRTIAIAIAIASIGTIAIAIAIV